METDISWPSEWLRGVLGVCVMRILADGPTYGYEIAGRLADAGLGTVKGGTLPAVRRFEDAGWVEIEWRPGDGGPGRKYYSLTPSAGPRLPTKPFAGPTSPRPPGCSPTPRRSQEGLT